MAVYHSCYLPLCAKDEKAIRAEYAWDVVPISFKNKWLEEKVNGRFVVQRGLIIRAACIHATCQQEMEYVREYGYRGPIAIIPNPVVFPNEVSLSLRDKSTKYRIEGKKQIGFLGRLHPIKKVENIIYAISLLNEDERQLISFQVMGKFDKSYEAFLRSEANRLNLENVVTFVGFVTGVEKYERLSQISTLMVPSEQENFGMIVPEALICGTPVYASLGTPWSELNEHKLRMVEG